jgi:DNA-binding XRE family transcriptional regulator
VAVQTAWLRDRNTFAEIVSHCGLSERELARQASLGHATVNHLLTGRRRSCSVHTARTIAQILGVDLHELFVV